MRAILISLIIFIASLSYGADFDITVDLREDFYPDIASAINLAPSLVQGLQDGDFFLYLNADDYDTASDQPSCYGPINDLSDCYSFTDWADRTIDQLFQYQPFIDYVQDFIDEAFLEPLMDEDLIIPLIGEWNIGLHFHDLWNNSGCSDPSSGPPTLKDPNKRIGCIFADDDEKGLDITEILTYGNYEIKFKALGTPSASQLPIGQMSDGALSITVVFYSPIDLDIIMRQPDSPAHNTGYYMHAAGKLRLANLKMTLDVNSVGGNLRAISFADERSAGGSFGLSLRYMRLQGSATLDADGFDCSFNGWCDSASLAVTHPFYGNQAGYESKTNSVNEALVEAVRYLEAHMVFEAERTVSAAEQYLSAFDLLDLYSVTHKLTPQRYEAPILEHPFGGAVTVDYGFFYRWDSDINDSILLFGGAGFDIQYEYTGDCLQSIPPPPRYPVLTYPELTPLTAKNGRNVMVGAGIHVNALNRILDKLYETNALCIRVDKSSSILGSAVDILTTDSFSAFLPFLREEYSGKDIRIVLKPRYQSATSPVAAFDPLSDQPYFTINLPSNPYDVTLTLPHIEVEFFIIDEATPIKLFGVEVAVNVDFGVGVWIANPALSSFPAELSNSNCAAPPYPCRVFRLSGRVESSVNRINQYNLGSVIKKADLEGAISQFLTLTLNGVLEANIEVFSDLRSILGFTVDPSVQLAATDPAFYGTVVEPIDLDGDGVYEYLGLYLNISDVYLEDGQSDIIVPWVLFDAVKSLAPAYEQDMGTFWDFPFYRGKEIYLNEAQVRKLLLYDMVHLDVTSLGVPVLYQFQIDDGLFQNSYDGVIDAPKQFYGHHTIKVWGIDKRGALEFNPAILRYDLFPPAITNEHTFSGCGVGMHGSWYFMLIITLIIITIIIKNDDTLR